MRKQLLINAIAAFMVVAITGCASNKKIIPAPVVEQIVEEITIDTAIVSEEKEVEEKKKKKSKIKEYSEIITSEAVSDTGLFTVHKVEKDHYFEIPNDLLEKEILITTRISGFVKNLNFGGAGVESRPERVIRWQRRDDQIFLRYVSYNSVADEEDPIYRSVKNNNFEPIVMIFDIKAFGPDSLSNVIDVSPLFTKEVTFIGAISTADRKRFGIRSFDSGRSFINTMKAFPNNVEVKHVITYSGTSLPANQVTGTMSLELSQSFILLPEIPMTPRLYDARVGYFSLSQTNYSLDEQKAAQQRFITKWRLEPKPEDADKYFAGELVEPIKPIVYYIDPATPQQWRPYLKQGINDWNIAFEQAGFKNAIIAKDPPTEEEDPDWSPEDVRYSVIRYVSTDIQNAMGPHVHDPRTGEILESDIIWYHNVMKLLRNWFFIQTAAINPDAAKVKFSDETMGRLIRFVSAHEVGHTLGLPHNMGSSVAYPVDSLRSPSFTQKMGTAPSIMDYARFNYVAQPGDGDVGLMPNIGPYDKWAIDFGYRLYKDMDDPWEERTVINQRIVEKSNDPIYRFGRQRGAKVDPTAQTEDLGDNSMRAGELGIANLKRIVPNLIEWTQEDAKDYSNLGELYTQVRGQYRRYINHVVTNVGGVYEYFKTSDQEEAVYTHVEKAKQKDAIKFLNKEVFQTPTWLIDKDVLSRVEETGIEEHIRSLQEQTLAQLFNRDRLKRMTENHAFQDANAYTIVEMCDDLIAEIFKEIKGRRTVDIFRRNLQRTFIEGLERVYNVESNAFEHSDMRAVAAGTLKEIKRQLIRYRTRDRMSRFHADDLIERIDKIFDPKS